MKTNRKVKKLFSYVLTAAMVITAVTPAFAGKVKAVAAGLTLTEQSGWLESAYVEWQPVKNAEGYVAYVKEASASDDAYEKLDDTLIRQYADYWRADALGLKEGSYVMKVTAVLKDGKTVSESTSSLEVEKYDRSGFAFSENSKFQTGSGAYNDDRYIKEECTGDLCDTGNSKDLYGRCKRQGSNRFPVNFRCKAERRNKRYFAA